MPIFNEIRLGEEIGLKGRRKHIWAACGECGKGRWVEVRKGKAKRELCRACTHTGNKSSQWKGGITHTPDGYVQIKLSRNDFFHSMTNGNNGYVLEHRLVMAKYLGRCLQIWEHVHHKNGKRGDNRFENLSLVLKGNHNGKVECPFCHKEFNIR